MILLSTACYLISYGVMHYKASLHLTLSPTSSIAHHPSIVLIKNILFFYFIGNSVSIRRT